MHDGIKSAQLSQLIMSAPPPTFTPLLNSIRDAINEALRNEKQNVPEQVEHLPLH
jgi:hypothetical protein